MRVDCQDWMFASQITQKVQQSGISSLNEEEKKWVDKQPLLVELLVAESMRRNQVPLVPSDHFRCQ